MLKKLAPGCSNGKVLKSLDNAGFVMTEIAYSANSRLSKHSHENAIFCFVLNGGYTEFDNNQELECKPSTLTFRPRGEIHEDKFHKLDVRVFTIEIPPVWIEKLRQDSGHLDRSNNFHGDSIARLPERIYREFRRMDTAANIIMEGLTLEMMAEASRRAAQKIEFKAPLWLNQAKDLLHARFTENLTLEQIAMEVNIHPVHLATVFRQKYYCTIGECIRQLRIEYASREIERGKMPLANIALEAGFADQGHFSSTFKRLTGITPGTYRKLFRKS